MGKVLENILLHNYDLTGLFHLSVNPINKFDLLKLVAEIYKKDIKIIEDNNVVIDRSLNSSNLRSITGYNPPSWRELITELNQFYNERFKNKKFLIFGGTGSFGHAVLERLLSLGVSKVRVFSRDEKKQHDMRLSISDKRLEFVIGDVRNFESVLDSMNDIDYVFFAAALKQVPSCEFYPMEALRTNVLGAENVIRGAIEKEIKSAFF